LFATCQTALTISVVLEIWILDFAANSHAIAGGFSPAIATALYTNVGLTAAGLVYVVFGSVSVFGIYVNYFCGRGDKEEDTGGSEESPQNHDGSLEMQENKPDDESSKDTPGIV
jgi:hypothetical protein